MEGVVALLIPIVAVSGFFAWMIALSPVGKAFAERLRGGTGPSGGAAATDAVLQELEQLRHEVAELAERGDFTERFPAKQPDGEGPPPPPRGGGNPPGGEGVQRPPGANHPRGPAM